MPLLYKKIYDFTYDDDEDDDDDDDDYLEFNLSFCCFQILNKLFF
jgi:hypothetical protein